MLHIAFIAFKGTLSFCRQGSYENMLVRNSTQFRSFLSDKNVLLLKSGFTKHTQTVFKPLFVQCKLKSMPTSSVCLCETLIYNISQINKSTPLSHTIKPTSFSQRSPILCIGIYSSYPLFFSFDLIFGYLQ